MQEKSSKRVSKRMERGVGWEKGVYSRDRNRQGICALGHTNTKALR